MNRALRLPVKGAPGETIGIMSRAQARRYGEQCMPADLRRAGFEALVFESDPALHGGHYFRVNYGKKVGIAGV